MVTCETFEMTEQHLALLKHANVRWSEIEAGAPAIDPKRPYGNSNVAHDMARILGIPLIDDEYLPHVHEERLAQLHHETHQALEIVLQHGHVLGAYRLIAFGEWAKEDPALSEARQ